MRLINADALKEVICSNVYPVTDFFNSRDYGMFWTGGIEKAIDEAPTIEAEPVKYGKWLMNDVYGAYCSECGSAAFEITGSQYSRMKTRYCWQCGARMHKEDTL